MVAQVYIRGMMYKPDSNKASSMFIKKNEPKKIEVVKSKDPPIVEVKVVNKK